MPFQFPLIPSAESGAQFCQTYRGNRIADDWPRKRWCQNASLRSLEDESEAHWNQIRGVTKMKEFRDRPYLNEIWNEGQESYESSKSLPSIEAGRFLIQFNVVSMLFLSRSLDNHSRHRQQQHRSHRSWLITTDTVFAVNYSIRPITIAYRNNDHDPGEKLLKQWNPDIRRRLM